MAKPTEQAEKYFDYAQKAAKVAAQFLAKPKLTPEDTQLGAYNQAVAMVHLTRGLSELAVGLRATYLLLEQQQSAART